MGESGTATVETRRSELLLEVTINRPDALNALNEEVLLGLRSVFSTLPTPDVRAVIITGQGEKSFVAGADVAAMAKMSADEIAEYIDLGNRVMRAIELYPAPVIAAVNGFALGGGLELALSCDLIVASDRAKIGQPEVNLGIIPGFGGTQRLLHRCGRGVARRLCLLGEIISAEEALSLGVVDRIAPASEVMAVARSWGALAASKGPGAVAGAKRVLRECEDGRLLAGLQLEQEKFLSLFRSSERIEGMTAFLEKRSPRFNGER